MSILDGLTEKQAGQQGARLVDMAKVEALEMVGRWKAVERMDSTSPDAFSMVSVAIVDLPSVRGVIC